MNFAYSRHQQQPPPPVETRERRPVVIWDAAAQVFRVEDLNRLVDSNAYYVVEQSTASGCNSMRVHGPFSVRGFAQQLANKLESASTLQGFEVFGAARRDIEFLEFVGTQEVR